MRVTIFHNPSCSKSRRVLEFLGQRGVECDVVDYRRSPPGAETLERIVALVGGEATELVRRDARFRELGLVDSDVATAAQVVETLLAHPELMQRPIVVRGDRAVVARPPEKVLELLD